ncbi:hypothetical protein QN277_023514 [Acacia crassicarpa]|uniref:Uncharacterized protein n=1 Tax=Acacia crassicarpa TaxID=499986 RepID=A0AAE1JLH4_9FABA|nr:hypothetical protein QN277_023514 [Acacia crassicarpa]
MDVARVVKSGQKRARHETIIGPAIDKDVAHEAVGVKPATLVPKEIPVIKKKNPILQIKFAPKAIQSEHKDGNSMEELVEPEKETLDPKEFLIPVHIHICIRMYLSFFCALSRSYYRGQASFQVLEKKTLKPSKII